MRTKLGPLVAVLVLACASRAATATPCVASATSLCLSGGRFEVKVAWADFQGKTGDGQAISLTADTGYFWFFNSSNIELVVKVLDARGINQKFWVFFGALSNVEYTLTVTDSVTSTVKTYFNPRGQFASVGDTSAFEGSETAGAAPPEAAGAPGIPVEPHEETTAGADFTPCLAAVTDLFLSGCRFQIEVSWQDSQGHTGDGKAVQLTDDTGYFWFFSPSNVELMIKVLDAHAIDGNFWVFFGALSDVQYQISITDTLSGEVKTYTNPQGAFASVGDTAAFAVPPSLAETLDDAHAATARFDDTGGTLTATGADGTQFVLTIPAGAIALPVPVRMTPISRLDALPFDGPLVAAVHIEPDGLLLMERGDLTILPAPARPLAGLSYFRYRGPGESFTQYPGVPQTSVIDMPVTYLAAYGAAAGTPLASSHTVRAKFGSASLTPYVAQVAAFYVQMMNGTISFETYLAEVTPIWDEAWTQAVLPALTALGDTCDPETFRAAIQLALEFLQLCPDAHPRYGSYYDTAFGIIKKKALACIDAAYQRCKSNLDPSEVALILALQAKLQRANLISVEESNEIWDKVKKCLTFQVDFESSMTVDLAAGGAELEERLKVRALVQVTISAEEHYTLSGSAPISYEFIDIEGAPCTFTETTTPDTFTVDRLEAGLLDAGRLRDYGLSVFMVYEPGNPEEQVTMACPLVPPATYTQWIFGPSYNDTHGDDMFGSPGQYRASDWIPVRAGNIFAKYSHRATVIQDGLRTDEETFAILKHTPQ